MASAPPLSVPRQRKEGQARRGNQTRKRQSPSPPSNYPEASYVGTSSAQQHVPLAQVVTESQVFDDAVVATAVPIQATVPQQPTSVPRQDQAPRTQTVADGQQRPYMPEALDWETCKSYFVFSRNFNPVTVLPKSQLNAKASESMSTTVYFNEEERIALYSTPPPQRSQVVFSSYGKWRKRVDKAKRTRSRGREYISYVVKDHIHDGVMSSHEKLNSPTTLREFIEFHNFPPSVHINIRAQRFDNSSEEGVFTEDFEVDISSYVLPYGKLTSMEKRQSIDEILETFCESEAKLKSIGVKKELHFNFKALFELIQAYFRSKLSYSNIQCSAQIRQTSVRVTSSEGYPRMWESQAGRVFTSLSVVGGLALAIQGIGVRRKNIRSTFAVPYSVIQIFKVVVDKLDLSSRPIQS